MLTTNQTATLVIVVATSVAIGAAHKYRALFDYMVSSGQFNTSEPKYWEQHVLNLREQLSAMSEN
jgi:hypothetical protein